MISLSPTTIIFKAQIQSGRSGPYSYRYTGKEINIIFIKDAFSPPQIILDRQNFCRYSVAGQSGSSIPLSQKLFIIYLVASGDGNDYVHFTINIIYFVKSFEGHALLPANTVCIDRTAVTLITAYDTNYFFQLCERQKLVSQLVS